MGGWIGWVGPLFGAQQQPADPARAAAEATSQAAEADRLYKARQFEQALPLYRAEQKSRAALNDPRGEAYAWRASGCCLGELGDDPGAIEAWNRARTLDAGREDPGYAGYDDLLIAGAQTRLGKVADAIASLNRALPGLSQAIDRDHEVDARILLARLLLGQDDAGRAIEQVDQAILLADQLGEDDPRRVDSRELAGQVHLTANKLEPALGRFTEARDLADRRKDGPAVARLEAERGEALAQLGRADEALARFREAVRLHAQLADKSAEAQDRVAVAALLIEREDPAAEGEARQAVALSHDANDPAGEVEARVVLARCLGRKGDWTGAADTLGPAVDLVRQTRRDDPAERIRILLQAAVVDRLTQRPDSARLRIDQARKLANTEELKAAVKRVEFDNPKSMP